MELIKCKIPKNAEIIITSDWHEGSALQHKNGIESVIEYVMAKPNRYMIHGGDLVEAIAVDDKRYHAAAVDPSVNVPLLQYQGIIKKLQPIAVAKKLLGIHEGNHDERFLKFGDCVRDIVCKTLGVPYATYSAKYSMQDASGKTKFKIFVTHGNGQLNSAAKDHIQRNANMAANLKLKLHSLAGDCKVMAMGHTHKLMVVEPVHDLYLIDDGTRIKQRYTIDPSSVQFIHPDHRWYLNTGSMMKLYGDNGVSGYAEKMMLKPVELGYCIVEIDNHEVANVRRVVV